MKHFISPILGKYIPEISFNNVLLPAPLGPISATLSPYDISRLIFFRAVKKDILEDFLENAFNNVDFKVYFSSDCIMGIFKDTFLIEIIDC